MEIHVAETRLLTLVVVGIVEIEFFFDTVWTPPLFDVTDVNRDESLFNSFVSAKRSLARNSHLLFL
ncbi:hypothetical protein C482_01675 [Natrialba chahannaoensis JCM 10990]|uniref:Uncharacterized protein n=1 Tax=Natrialba chahannaoensis JCM 10990 TaxID=1227492 RepID=M0B7L1_9EURY|nr:hypothetical protein C482_01675 [Natrialba chahannaoensis JCM 10990]